MPTLSFVQRNHQTTASQQTCNSGAAFTPAAGDGLILGVVVSGNTTTPTITDTQSLGWTQLGSATYNTSGSKVYLFAANKAAAASSETVTADLGAGQSSSNWWVAVWKVASATRFGSSAIRSGQVGTENNADGANNPAPTLPTNAISTNGIVVIHGLNTAAGDTTTPVELTQSYDDVFNGSSDNSWGYHATGFSGTVPTYVDHPANGATFASIIVELDFSAVGAPTQTIDGAGGIAKPTILVPIAG